MTEDQLIWIAQLKKGNDLAAYNIYNQYVKAMYNTAIRISGDSEATKDLVQEAFIKAFKKISALKDPRSFPGWLKQIVVNTALEHVRKKKIQFEEVREDHSWEEELTDEALISDQDLHQAIKSLPHGCRTVLSLHLFEEMKHSEIAEALNISVSTSKTQYRHAKKLLKEKLAHYYES